ncbi:lytic transglycosylase domain-containing protein [Sphingobium chungangianum]
MAPVKRAAILLALALATPAKAESVASWQPYIREASLRFGIPTVWIERVMRAESGGQTRWNGRPVRSSAGAIGLMQLMPATWTEMRVRLGLGDDPDEPRDNILAGTFYLRLMHERFGYPGLFAAYNAGPGRYAEHLAGRRPLPGETIGYLASVAPERQIGGASPPVEPLFAIQKGGGLAPAAAVGAPSPSPIFVVLSQGN